MFDSIFGFSIILNAVIVLTLYIYFMLDEHMNLAWVSQIACSINKYEYALVYVMFGAIYYTCVGSLTWLILQA